MAKKHDDQDEQTTSNHSESHSEIHVESHSEQHLEGGEAVDAQLEELTNDLKRVQAEFVNFKRRADDERAELMDYAKARVVREFLSVRDSFDAELAHRPADVDAKWAESIDSIRAQFDKVMKQLGVERFESVGQPFDPHLHEAIATDGSGDVVTEELQSGYKLGDTVLRHAMVKVGDNEKTAS